MITPLRIRKGEGGTMERIEGMKTDDLTSTKGEQLQDVSQCLQHQPMENDSVLTSKNCQWIVLQSSMCIQC